VETTKINKIDETASASLTRQPDADGSFVHPDPSKVAEACSHTEYRLALLTPYDGGNLGDAAIQDAMIDNIRRRLPGVRLSGISLSPQNFMKLHGLESFPLCETDRPFYKMTRGVSEEVGTQQQSPARPTTEEPVHIRIARKLIRRVPFLRTALKAGRKIGRAGMKEFRHWAAGYRFLRTQDLVIVSGGGQLDEEWGGPWGHPYALFKWAMLARIARIPYAMASVGACKLRSTSARLLVSAALRLARYRAYRDKNSRDLAAGLLQRASADPIVPDLAFGLSVSELPQSASIRLLAAGRPVIAISPIAFNKPPYWPQADPQLYSQYLEQLTEAVSVLLERGYFLVMVSSSRGDDESVIPDILGRLHAESKKKADQQICVPPIATWRDFASVVSEVHLLIASRLHSTILGLIAHRPTVAISFDPKVDWVMKDLDQTAYLLHIRDFVAQDLVNAVSQANRCRAEVIEKLTAYQSQNRAVLARQYDLLVGLAMRVHRSPASRCNV